MNNLKSSDDPSPNSSSTSRRTAIRTIVEKYAVLASSLSSLATISVLPAYSLAAGITDEAGSSENTYSDSMDTRKRLGLDASSSSTNPKPSIATDEITITVPTSQIISDQNNNGGLGIQLADIEYQSAQRVYVKAVKPNSLGAQLGIQKDWILVTVDGQSTERYDANGVALVVSKAVRDATTPSGVIEDGSRIRLVFRDPSVFRDQIRGLEEGGVATTQIAPGGRVKGGESQEDQQFSVSKLVDAKYCQRKAVRGDLLEISYLGTVVESGAVFDGGAIKINGKVIPGRGNDTTVYFVLGNQPRGQFPPSWDVGLEGICVGERRRILVPPVLGFGSAGVPRRGIPPDATLQYDVTLVSLNGLSTP